MILLSSIHLHHQRAALDANVTWIAPQINETLQAGQNYIAKWNASTTPQSPSFQLCTDPSERNGTSEGSCGSPVSAPLQHDQGGYFVSLTLPNLSPSIPFILKMHDEYGFDSDSPSFFIQPASVNGSSSSNNASSSPPTASQTDHAIPGLLFQLLDPAQGPNSSQPLLIPKPSFPSAPILSGISPPVPTTPQTKRSFSFSNLFNPSTSTDGSPLYTALAIIPLVLVTLGLSIALFMWYRQRRNTQLKKLYLTDHPMVYPRRPVLPKTLNSAEDLEVAVRSLEEERRRGRREERRRSGRMKIFSGNGGRKERDGDEERELREKERRLEEERLRQAEALIPPEKGRYEPEPRCLTASYFPPAISLPFEGPPSARAPPPTFKPNQRKILGKEGTLLVDSPLEMHAHEHYDIPSLPSTPDPSVTKMSERVSLRSRSSSSSHGGSESALA